MVALPHLEQPPTCSITLLDVKNHLYSHFMVAATFSLKDDLGAVKLGSVYDDAKGALASYKPTLFRAALDDMVKVGVLLALDPVVGVYTLTQPLGTFNQNVVISPYTANLIADAFNFFARQTGPQPYLANKLAITDIDINAVAQICFTLRDQLNEIIDDMDGGDSDEMMPPLGGGPANN